MKLLFAHDHRFIPRGETVYSSGSFSYHYWKRYLAFAREVIVLGRRGKLDPGTDFRKLQKADAPGVRFVFLPNLSSIRGRLLKKREATAIIRERLCDVDGCIVRLPSEVGFAVADLCERDGIPYAIEVAGCPQQNMLNYGTLRAKLYAPFVAARMRSVVQRSRFTLYVTQQALQARYPPAIDATTVACSNVEIPTPRGQVLEARLLRIASDRSPFRLGLIGSMRNRAKGIQVVLRALANLQPLPRELEFHILGSGSSDLFKEEAEALGVSDITYFDGTLPAGDPINSWLSEIDLYLQPSLTEGLPRALVEAMSQACPAIASRCGGIPELLPREDLVEPGDDQQLSLLLARRIADTDWQRESAKRNWAASIGYSKETLDKRRTAFWEDFCNHVYDAKRSRA